MHIEEEKKETILLPDIEAARATAPTLYHLNGFDNTELQKLQALYNKPLADLESAIDSYPKLNWYFYFNFFVANYGSCGLFLIFPIITSNQGIDTIVQIFKSDINVPDAIGYGIGAPLSVIEVIMFMSLFSVRKEAAKATLAYAMQKPWRELLGDAYAYAHEEPGKALIYSAQFLANQSLLVICNLTGTMSELIYIPLDYSTWYARLLTAITLFYGLEYFKAYTNPNYYEGLDFFFRDKHPGLLSLLRDWDLVTPMQIILQSTSAIGLRVFPLYYYFAVVSEQVLGLWFNPYLVAALSSIQGVFMLYPSSFNHYMNDYEKLKAHFSENPEALSIQQAFRKEFLREHGYRFLFKNEPMTVLLIATRSLLGAYFGYCMATRFLADLMNPAGAQALCIPVGALSFGSLLFSAEFKRVLRQEHVKKLGLLKEEAIPESAAPAKKSYSAIFAVFLNVTGSLVSAMSTVGTLQPLIGNDLPEVTTVITLLAIERMLNTIYFNRAKVEDSVKDLALSCRGFFKPKPTATIVENQNLEAKKPWYSCNIFS